MKEDDMKIGNKVALIAASVITASALVLASPALAHKNPSHGNGKGTTKSAVATPSATPSIYPSAPSTKAPHGDRDGRHGKGHGKGKDHKAPKAPLTKTVTVDVPETGTYQLLVSEVKPAKVSTKALERPEHSFTVPVTGTGSQTITLTLPHKGDYTVALVSVVSTQSVTATN